MRVRVRVRVRVKVRVRVRVRVRVKAAQHNTTHGKATQHNTTQCNTTEQKARQHKMRQVGTCLALLFFLLRFGIFSHLSLSCLVLSCLCLAYVLSLSCVVLCSLVFSCPVFVLFSSCLCLYLSGNNRIPIYYPIKIGILFWLM